MTGVQTCALPIFDGKKVPYVGKVQQSTAGTSGTTTSSGEFEYAMDGISTAVYTNVLDNNQVELTLMPVLSSIENWATAEIGGNTMTAPIQPLRQGHFPFIGKHGQTLDAIQYLTNLVANKEVSGHYHIVVDVEHYRSRREETLMQLARRLASKVKRTRQKVSLEPMSAYERKIIHLTLQDESHIVTDSEGEEPYRHVVIAYKK